MDVKFHIDIVVWLIKIVNLTGAVTPLFALVEVQMYLDRNGIWKICAY